MSSVQGREGYQSSSSLSPASLAGVVIVHLGLGAAILSMTAITVFKPKPEPIWVDLIPAAKPEVDPVQAKPAEPMVDRQLDIKPTIVLPHEVDPDNFIKPQTFPDMTSGGGVAPGFDTIIKPVETPAPVLVDAKPDARFLPDFQPPYPASMVRMQMEGNVTVRLTIGANGRVMDVVLVSAPDPAFFEATRRQALSRWRFVPATRDGVAVVSERVMTVKFRLTD